MTQTEARPSTERDANGHKYVGKPAARMEGPAKVTGRTIYADDMKLPHMLHAKILGSPYAHARIKSINTQKARLLPGVEAVITAADLPKYKKNPTNRRSIVFPDTEALFAGQPIAAVLASDPHVAEAALALIELDLEALPNVIDPMEAMKDGSPLVHSSLSGIDRSEEQGHVAVDLESGNQEGKASNIASTTPFKRGDVEAGFAEADVIIERSWRSAMVHQSYIEPHSTIADYADGELSVWTSTQAPFYIREELATALDIPESKVRVTATEVGGGFGGKIYLSELMVSLLAMVVRRPVKYIMSRGEDMVAATPAPFAQVDLKTGMKKDGTITAIKSQLVYDSGAYPGASVAAGALLIGGLYRCANLDIVGYEVLTNKASVGALRAPSAHNATYAIECHIDMMAKELGLDPIEVRLKNAVVEGDPLPSGQAYPAIGLAECIRAMSESNLWKGRAASKQHKNRGVGVAVGGWMGGLQPASAIVTMNPDATFNVTVGCADITGVNTTFQSITAEVLNIPREQITVTYGDTKTAPYAGMSAGSKTTYTVGRAVKLAAEDARRQIFEVAATRLEATPDELEIEDEAVRVIGDAEKSIALTRIGRWTTNFGARYPVVVGRGSITATKMAPGFTCQAAEVEVDTDTGEITLLNYAIAQDCGFAINPLSVEGQMQGGVSQGLGIALWEEMQYNSEGQLLNANLLDYRLPTARDLPKIETIIVEVASEEGPFGARIVGEPSIVPGAAAVANAVADAIGVFINEVPITPERVLRALGKIGNGTN
ncbi:MAG: xanthine dehydrogenase family protein molybdopterin-binding subunit [Chloroflexota bacterium]